MIGLKKNSDFSRVYRRGASRADRLLVLYALKREDDGPGRFGVSVSKKVGNSVVRHRIKRRLKEIYRLGGEAPAGGYDIAVIARKPAAEADYFALEQSLIHLINKLC